MNPLCLVNAVGNVHEEKKYYYGSGLEFVVLVAVLFDHVQALDDKAEQSSNSVHFAHSVHSAHSAEAAECPQQYGSSKENSNFPPMHSSPNVSLETSSRYYDSDYY